jgi:hypothetical protein
MMWGWGGTLWARLVTEADGIVISREYFSPTPLTHGSHVDYQIRRADGSILDLSAGPTDASLSKNISVGMELQKRKWELSYKLDGRLMDDFPRVFYFSMIGAAFAGLIWARRLSLRKIPQQFTWR